MPSAPPSASGTIGSSGESTARSPTLSVSTRIVGTVASPVTPRSMTGGERGPDAERECHHGGDPGAARARIEHEAEGSAAVDEHRRPDAPDLVARVGAT